MAKETQSTQGYWARQYIWHSQRHSQERRTLLQVFWPGEFCENCRQISQRILMANFFCELFHLVISGVSGPPPPKFTPKVHAQNCRHSSPISLSRTQNFVTAIFCLRGRPFLGGLQRSPQKYNEKSLEMSIFGPFGVFFDRFGCPRGLLRQTPKRSFLRVFWRFLESPETLRNGGLGRNFFCLQFGESSRGNTIGATGPRASEMEEGL